MRTARLIVLLAFWLGLPASALGQFKQRQPGGPKLGPARVQRLQVGIVVSAVGGPCRGIVGYAAVPDDWPEQQVKTVEEDISPSARVSYQSVGGMVRAMVVRIPLLRTGEQSKALVTFEVRRSPILPPENTEVYRLPEIKKLDRKIRAFLSPSPRIESRDRRIRALAKRIGAEQQTAWERIEAIYDWVRAHVRYQFDRELKGAVAALNAGVGDCEELTSLFIAICRAANIPARTVHVQGHCYPEFYLVDEKGQGHWFPCQAAGTRAFGEIPEYRPILQKGDNLRPPYNRRLAQRYLADHLTGTGTGGQPRVRFVRRMVSE